MTETSGIVSDRPPRYELLDCLRLLAAAMVVLFHYLVNGINDGKVATMSPNGWATAWAKYGFLGVSLFFLISGFVITLSARGRTARQFAVGRFLRLYPAFWIAVAFTATITVLIGAPKFHVSAKEFVLNLTMFPGMLGVPLVDGVYWTLLCEIEFYLLVMVVLFVGQGKRLEMVLAAWTILMVIASVISPAAAAAHPGTGGYFLLFGCGALIATIRDRGPVWWAVVPLLAGYAMCVWNIAGHADLGGAPDLPLNHAVEVVILTAFFVAVASMCLNPVARLRLPGSAGAGALTYPLYLLHATFGYMVFDRFGSDSNKWLIYPLQIVIAVTLAWLLHLLVDRDPRRARMKNAIDATLGQIVERLQPKRWRRGEVEVLAPLEARIAQSRTKSW